MKKRFISILLSMTIISSFSYVPVLGVSGEEARSIEADLEMAGLEKEEITVDETIDKEELEKTLEETLLEIENLLAKAEETKAIEDIERARLAVEALEDSPEKIAFLERLEVIGVKEEEVLIPIDPIEVPEIVETTEVVEEVEVTEELEEAIEGQELLSEEVAEIEILEADPTSIYGKKLIEIVPDRRIAEGLLSKAFKGENIDTFIVTEENMPSFKQLYYGEKDSNNYETVDFEGVQHFKNLRTINIGMINIDKFPSQVLELYELRSLELRGIIQKPRISEATIEIPEEITRLTKLTNIDFNNNMVKELPDFLSEMTQLRWLNFTGSNYYHDSEFLIPESYVKLVNLNDFAVSNNHMKYLPSNLHEYQGLKKFRFVYNELLEISQENYDYIREMKENKYLQIGGQHYRLVQDAPHNKTEANGFIDIAFPQFVDFMSDLSLDKGKLGIEDIVFRLYSSQDDYETRDFIRRSGPLKDDDGDGIYVSEDGLFKYDSISNKFLISNEVLKDPNDDFRFTAKMYDSIFKEATYRYDFTTVTDYPFETEYKYNLDMAPGQTRVSQEGINGTKNNKGIVRPAVNKIIEYGPDAIAFDTIRRENPDLAPGEEKVVVEGVVGRVDKDGTILVEKVDKIIEFGPPREDDGPIIIWPPTVDKVTEIEIAKPESALKMHIQYIQGYPDGRVRPDSKISRAEAAAMLARLLELKLEDKTSPDYKDMKNDMAWYNRYVNAVTSHGLMEGYPDGSFAPEEEISRGEFAKMIESLGGNERKKAPFTDIDGHWAMDAIEKAYGKGSIDGYPDMTFRPDKSISRAETAKILNHVFYRMVRTRGLEELEGSLNKYLDLETEHWAYYEIVEASNSHKYTHYKDEFKDENWTVITQKMWDDVRNK